MNQYNTENSKMYGVLDCEFIGLKKSACGAIFECAFLLNGPIFVLISTKRTHILTIRMHYPPIEHHLPALDWKAIRTMLNPST
jgi:hypothetical protein